MEMNSMVMWYVGVLERYGEINRLLVSFRLPPDEIDHVFTQKTLGPFVETQFNHCLS